jgi:hypothetical protein
MSPIHKPNKKTWPKTADTGSCSVRKFDAVFCQKQRNKNEIYVLKMQRAVVRYPMFWSISHQTVSLRTNWH